MKIYALIIGLDDAERDDLLKLLQAPDLAHLRAALMEIGPRREWWEQPPPFECLSVDPAKVTDLYNAPPPSGVVARRMKITWTMRVTEWRRVGGETWLCVNASPTLWVLAGRTVKVQH